VKIVIADDHRMFRQGLRNLLERRPGVRVVGEADNGQEAVTLARRHSPDLVIMDVSMPGLNGIEATRMIRARQPAARILGLSMHADRRFVVEMLKHGALGYVLKDAAFEELSQAIRQVLKGQIYLSPSVANLVVKDYIDAIRGGGESAFAVLSPREREVLQLLAEGKGTKQIAARLNVSVKTVESHRKQIMDKLDIHSLAELTKYAVREGITTLEIG
jgi:DNA-binding NarL/FixJ family response regulator